jgi:hypothetical protein
MLVGPLLPQPAQRGGSATSRGTSRATRPEAPPSADAIALALRQQAFDQELRVRAELQREGNALRALIEEQRKRDDEFLRKAIELI